MKQPTLTENCNSQTAHSSSAEWIDTLAAEHRSGWSLPQRFYNDPAIFQRDFERIFMKEWVFAGHESRLRKNGDFFLFTIGGESIIIIRGKDGKVHAHFNVCRHRGSRICLEPSGSKQTLVCPYHAWTYAADGRLLSAPAMSEDFNQAEFGLHRCNVRVVEGLIFVNLSRGTPPDREAIFQDWERYLRPYRLGSTKIAATMVWRVDANWKLVVENFDECYHCGPAHPEYCSVMAHAIPATHRLKRDVEPYQAFYDRWAAEDKLRGNIVGPAVHEKDMFAVCAREPIREGSQTQSQDGRPVAPLLGELKEYDNTWTYGQIYPANYILGLPDHALIPRFTPISSQVTEVEMIWLVRDGAVEGRDYQVDKITWLWRVTTEQDKKIVDDNQAGVNSVTYQPGPYSDTERGLVRFTDWYIKQIRNTP